MLKQTPFDFSTQVSTEEGKHLATQFGCPFYETSAALRHYIDDAFYTLIREIRRKENQRVILVNQHLNVDLIEIHYSYSNFFFGSQATVRARKRLIRIDVADGGEFVRFLHLFFVAGDEIEHQPGTINDVCVCVLIKHRVRIKL